RVGGVGLPAVAAVLSDPAEAQRQRGEADRLVCPTFSEASRDALGAESLRLPLCPAARSSGHHPPDRRVGKRRCRHRLRTAPPARTAFESPSALVASDA